MMSVVQYFSPTIATKILYRKYFGCSLNMKNPDTLNAKMQWLKLKVYQNSPVVRECVDKYAVRDYIKRKNREDALVPLIGVWNSVDEIDWDSLPSKFVMKCNHGSGSVLICKDKALFDVNNAKIKLKKWLAEDFGTQRAELSYKGVKKKILCEALIETDDGKSPKDYKFFCNYGEPKFLFVASDRHGEHAFFDYYDLYKYCIKWIFIFCKERASQCPRWNSTAPKF